MKPFSILENVMTKSERKRMQFVGIKRTLKPNKRTTSLERNYYMMLDQLGVEYIPQFPLKGRLYDAYLPDHNILFEFDGAFWHPKSAADAKYGFQKKSVVVDEEKNTIAKANGYKLIRIREDEPVDNKQMRKLIWG